MNYKNYLLWGIGAVLVVAAIVTGALIVESRRTEQSADAALLHSGTRLNTSVETGGNDRLLIQHEGNVYSLDGNKIIPVN